MLLGRDRELAALEAYYRGEFRLKIAIVEGRRGVGKTALCQEFLKGKNAVAVLHPSPSPEDALSNLSSAIGAALDTLHRPSAVATTVPAKLGDPVESTAAALPCQLDEAPSWEQFFSLVQSIAETTGKRPMLYFDDFPTLGAADPTFTKAFASELDPQHGSLRPRHAFILISGRRDGLGKALTEAGIDESLALNTNRLKIRSIGYKAALVKPASTVDELVANYGRYGGIPLRYTGKTSDAPLATPDAARETVSTGATEGSPAASSTQNQSSPTARDLALLLADAPNLFTGFTQSELCDRLDVKPLAFKRLFNELKGMDLASSVRAYWFADGVKNSTMRFRLADCADASDLRPRFETKASGEAVAGDCGRRAHQTAVEMLREWVWDAGRDGSFPFEFDEVSYWLSPDGDGEQPYGVLAISEQTNAVIACRLQMSAEPTTPAEVDVFVDLAHALPYKRVHCVLAVVEGTPECLDRAGEINDLTLAQLSADGFSVVSNPWQLHSERYQAAMKQAKEKAGAATVKPQGK